MFLLGTGENFQELPCYTCVRQPPLNLTLVVDVERWLSYKGTYHVILQAKLHDMYVYKIDNFFHINHYLKSVSKVALLQRFYCTTSPEQLVCLMQCNAILYCLYFNWSNEHSERFSANRNFMHKENSCTHWAILTQLNITIYFCKLSSHTERSGKRC